MNAPSHRTLFRSFALPGLAALFVFASAAGCGGGGSGSDDTGDDVPPDAACTTTRFYPDVDGDGFGDQAKGVDRCEAPAGFIAQGGDCDDTSPAVHPGGAEICDLIDNNCDGRIDDADPLVDTSAGELYYLDGDGDGFGTPATAKRGCSPPSGYVASSTDCDDTAAEVNPSAVEVCDFIDNNCNGLVDMADATIDLASTHTYYRDLDHDNYGSGAAMVACTAPSGFVATTGDCNDNNITAHPGATEVCDGADNDCDGGTDGTVASPNQCGALVGTYTGTYTHHTDERLGSTIINQMNCTGTGSASLALNRTPALQGSFTCVYNGGLGGFQHTQSVTLSASVGLDGVVTGTIHHIYDSFGADRTYNVTGTQTSTTLTLSGTGNWLPNSMSAVPWGVTFSFATSR